MSDILLKGQALTRRRGSLVAVNEVAMCLATAPGVLRLDEPLAGLGAEETERMPALPAESKTRRAILLVEHDMDAVAASSTPSP